MLKTVTLDNEEMELLLSHHKQKLGAVTKEIQTLLEKQRFSETRINELDELSHVHDEEIFSEEDLQEPEGLHYESNEPSFEETFQETESLNQEETERLFEEHSHETEVANRANNSEPVAMHLNEAEPMHHEDNEGPAF
jgi:hypothetical protein